MTAQYGQAAVSPQRSSRAAPPMEVCRGGPPAVCAPPVGIACSIITCRSRSDRGGPRRRSDRGRRCSGDRASAAGGKLDRRLVSAPSFPLSWGSWISAGPLGEGLRSRGGCCKPPFRQALVSAGQWTEACLLVTDTGEGRPRKGTWASVSPWPCGCRAHTTTLKRKPTPRSLVPLPFDLSRGVDLPSTAPKQKMPSSVLSAPGPEPFFLDPGFPPFFLRACRLLFVSLVLGCTLPCFVPDGSGMRGEGRAWVKGELLRGRWRRAVCRVAPEIGAGLECGVALPPLRGSRGIPC